MKLCTVVSSVSYCQEHEQTIRTQHPFNPQQNTHACLSQVVASKDGGNMQGYHTNVAADGVA